MGFALCARGAKQQRRRLQHVAASRPVVAGYQVHLSVRVTALNLQRAAWALADPSLLPFSWPQVKNEHGKLSTTLH